MTERKSDASMVWVIVLAVSVCCGVGAVAMTVLRPSRPEQSTLGPAYEYDVSEHKQTNPSLVLYRELPDAAFKTGLKTGRSIAVGPEGRIYLAGDQAIVVFESSGAKRAEHSLSGEPVAVAVGPDGRMFVAMTRQLIVLSPTGQVTAGRDFEQDNVLFASVAVSGEDVFLGDAGRRVVLRCDDEGEVLNEIARKDAARGVDGLIIPSGFLAMAVGPDGLLRVSNPGRHRVETYSADGSSRGYWGGTRSMAVEDFCGCCNPSSLAIDAAGRYITGEKGLTRVKLYDAAGDFLGVVAGPEAFAEHDGLVASCAECQGASLSVAVDAADRVLVLEPLGGRVRVFVAKDMADVEAE